MSKEHLVLSYRTGVTINKQTLKIQTIINTNINNNKSCKVGTAVEFQLLVLGTLQHNSSKAELRNNRSAKQSSVETLLLRHNQWEFCIFTFFCAEYRYYRFYTILITIDGMD